MFGQHPYEKPNAVGCADRVNWIQSGCNNISKFKNIRIPRFIQKAWSDSEVCLCHMSSIFIESRSEAPDLANVNKTDEL